MPKLRAVVRMAAVVVGAVAACGLLSGGAPRSASPGATKADGWLTGVVLNSDGGPAAGATVQVTSSIALIGRSGGDDGTYAPPPTATTDREGRFRLPGDGLSVVTAYTDHESIALDDPPPDGRVKLSAGGSLRVTLKGKDRSRIPDVWITAGARRAVRTANDGTARFGSLPAGTYPLGCSRRCDDEAASAVVRVGEETAVELPMVDDLDLTGRLIGGRRVARAAVTVVGAPDGGVDDYRRTFFTDGQGRFRGEARRGRYLVAVQTDEGVSTAEVELPQASVDLPLRPPAALTGRVLDANGNPMTHVVIRLRPELMVDNGTTEKDGSFTMRNLVWGDYVLVATDVATYTATSQPVHLEAGKLTRTVIQWPADAGPERR